MKRKSRRQSPSRMTCPPKSSARKPNTGDKKPTFSPTFSGCLGQKSMNSISDLKDLVSSGFHDLKSNLIDSSHSEILKDLEASHSRLFKRFKIQAQACQQNMENAEKDFKTMSERINDSCEAMKDSYADFMVDVQATTSHMCKTTIPDLSKSFEKAIANLQSRYGITST
ncbi:hypothetical protein K2173_002743 [Erythroxylum novogranatense]|uniref:Uncharacterized protein n=1 Tax=Erythroxylum novogranatense TaxID=1862640 RepID=A0AAV8SPU2_9ROSI|nr:hypothetical protein K2173_002743 [Erythroxylum novogranatense]